MVASTVQSVLTLKAQIENIWKRRRNDQAYIQSIDEFILAWPQLDAAEKVWLRERLASDRGFQAQLIEVKTKAELVRVLRRYGVLSTDQLDSAARAAMEGLIRERFGSGASLEWATVLEAIDEGSIENAEGFGKLGQDLKENTRAVEEMKALLAGTQIGAHESDYPLPVDIAVGNTVVLDTLLGFPLLTKWSTRLETALRPYKRPERGLSPVDALVAAVEEARTTRRRNSLSELIEDAVLLAADGYRPEAINRVERIRRRQNELSSEGKVLLFRLMGGLYLEVGDNDKALQAYARAWRLLEALPTKNTRDQNARAWLERQLRLDQLNTTSLLSVELDESIRRQNEMLTAPAWHANPAVDNSVRAFMRELTGELFSVQSKSDASMLVGTNVGAAIVHFKRALVLSYLGGNHFSANSIRVLFAQAAWPLRKSSLTESGVRFVLEELIEAHNATETKRFLGVYGHEVATLTDWNQLATEARTKPPIVGNADERDRTILAVVSQMADYLDDETIADLNAEFTDRSVTYLSGNKDTLVLGAGKGAYEFLEAFKQIFSPSTVDLYRLAGSLRNHDPREPFSFWELLSWHDWRDSDVDVAADIVETLIAKVNDSKGKGEGTTLAILVRIARRYEELDATIENWLLDQADRHGGAGYLRYLLDRSRPNAASTVAKWTRQLVDSLVEELEGTRAEQGLALGRMSPAFMIALAVQRYSDAFSPGETATMAMRIIRASSNPSIFTQLKSDVFVGLTEILGVLHDRQVVPLKQMLLAREPTSEAARTLVFGGDLYSPTPDEARIRLVELRIAAGIEPTSDDYKLLANALANFSNLRTLNAALRVMESYNHNDARSGMLYGLVTRNIILGSAKQGAIALTAGFLIRNDTDLPDELRPFVTHQMEALMEGAHIDVLLSILENGRLSWKQVGHDTRKWIARVAAEVENHRSRSVRAEAKLLLESLGRQAH